MSAYTQPTLDASAPTASDVGALHQRFKAHKGACPTCSPVPTVGPCKTGRSLEAARDVSAVSLMTAAAAEAGVNAIRRHPRRADTVVFESGELRGGIFHSPHDERWKVIAGKPGFGISNATSVFCAAAEITATIRRLVGLGGDSDER